MSPEDRRAPGRPRSETARRAILAATLELAGELGPRGLQMEAIARRAGVSKETLYRWWHSRAEVLLEALAERGEQTIPLPDTGSLGTDLREFLRATAVSADPATRQLLRALAAEAASDPAFAELARVTFLARRRAALAELLHRAIARQELTEAGADVWVDLIYGSLWYRLVFGVGPLDDTWADAIADAVTGSGPAVDRARR